MIIEQTKIPDVTKSNLPESKTMLAENIIRNIYPLFDEVFNEKVSQTKGIETKYQKKKAEVQNLKEELEKMMSEFKKKQKMSKLLLRVEKLVKSGLIYDGQMKHEAVILLKIIDKLPEDKLDYHLTKTLNIIHKRFRK